MPTEETFTIVTVTVVDSDRQVEAGSASVDDDGLEDAIDRARAEAAERYSDNHGDAGLSRRFITQIAEVPAPKDVSVSVVLPKSQEELVAVTIS